MVQLSACVALADAVSEAVVHQSRGRPAGLQDPAHAVGGRYRLLPWKGMSNLGPYFKRVNIFLKYKLFKVRLIDFYQCGFLWF